MARPRHHPQLHLRPGLVQGERRRGGADEVVAAVHGNTRDGPESGGCRVQQHVVPSDERVM
eukprot:CAMPEP_0181183568 /NCGR_PEP_ID=MMETSP1096-20121128/8496_1 /TAXON_ID=156174 ORGANISM="Chrysochromulina ericina, Strain CCMP281" /NCGR_SAMPLE_ID=MMETSP1096 /ASSEMBLY_ACC=CAM_ASM_000453 /LENGTH=60 /DNA_ID=CAMNT_0023272259 /DNA_START=414 /DNA_END=596 /DNA_ORIENTATION=+